MPWRTAPNLTKSNYLAGLQCSLRLWKQVHTPKPFVEPFPGTPCQRRRQIVQGRGEIVYRSG